MALNITIPLGDTGLDVRYWRLAAVSALFPNAHGPEHAAAGQITITMHGYKDRAARDGGSGPAMSRIQTVPFNGVSADLQDAITSMLYRAVKATPDFSQATDI